MTFIPIVLLGLCLTLAVRTAPVPAAESPRKLNVLLLVADDLNTALGCYGKEAVQTPNLDKLAARSVRFDRAYCQFPLCHPSRTSFLSGRRPDTTGVFGNSADPRRHLKDIAFLPEYFRQHGYFTARAGKITHYDYEHVIKWDDSVNDNGIHKLSGRGGDKDEEEPDGQTARRIIKLIEQNKDTPFFIAAGFHRPHTPLVAPKKYFDLYPTDKIVLPLEMRRQDKTTQEQVRQRIAAYYACVSFMDTQAGLILEALERLKLTDRTVVVFLSDHGFHLYEHGRFGKLTLYEESARVPLLVAAPGKKAGVASPRLVELVDLYPTVADLCGLKVPEGLEGISFVPLLDDPNRPWKKAVFTSSSGTSRGLGSLGRSVRTERWRYSQWGENTGSEELYDHEADPRETTNLAKDPRYADTVTELRQLLKEGWRAAGPGGR